MGTFLIAAGCIFAVVTLIILGVALCVTASCPIEGVVEPPCGGTHHTKTP